MAPGFTATAKYLAALALGVQCLSASFVQDCVRSEQMMHGDSYRLPVGWDTSDHCYIEWTEQSQRNLRPFFKNNTIYLPSSAIANGLCNVLKILGAKVVHRDRPEADRRPLEIGSCFALVSPPKFDFSDDTKQALEQASIPVLKVQYVVQCLAHYRKLPLFDFF